MGGYVRYSKVSCKVLTKEKPASAGFEGTAMTGD